LHFLPSLPARARARIADVIAELPMTEVVPAKAKAPRPKRSLGMTLVLGVVTGVALANTVEIVRMGFFRNTHVVVSGRVYRSAQFKPAELEEHVRKYGIRTVVNLRGRFPEEVYINQSKVIQKLGISQEDVTSSANRLPSPMEIRRLFEIFDRAEYPILIHCKQGADRTGLAAALYQMAYTNADYATARRQCMPRFGHFPILTTVAMDRFFAQYERWLAERQQEHTPGNVREWATTYYRPGPYAARLEIEESPKSVAVGEAFTVKLKATNLSDESWSMKAGTGVGIHARFEVNGPQGRVYESRAGLVDREVAPGESVVIELPVPAMSVPGRYRLRVDLSHRLNDFAHFGSEPVTYDWDTRGTAATPPR
jgi:protein tyrosine phosphatase (PTP) superfamily phosphohydrolase (DUF442 family)